MFYIITVLLFAAAYSYLFTLIPGLSLWFLFAWVPASIVISAALLLLTLVIAAYTCNKTKTNGWFRHMLLRNAAWIAINFPHVKMEVIGKENIPEETYVIYANHKSHLDPIMIYYACNSTRVTAVGKKSLFANPVMTKVKEAYGAYALDREDDREAAKTIVQAIKDVKKGKCVVIFPEGGVKSRETEEMVNLRAGAYKLALKPQATILPVAIVGSSKIKTTAYLKRKHVKLVFCKPITKEQYEGMNTTQVGLMVEEIINNTVKEYEEK